MIKVPSVSECIIQINVSEYHGENASKNINDLFFCVKKQKASNFLHFPCLIEELWFEHKHVKEHFSGCYLKKP